MYYTIYSYGGVDRKNKWKIEKEKACYERKIKILSWLEKSQSKKSKLQVDYTNVCELV